MTILDICGFIEFLGTKKTVITVRKRGTFPCKSGDKKRDIKSGNGNKEGGNCLCVKLWDQQRGGRCVMTFERVRVCV